MATGTLTLSSKLSPFPYSAIAIASYTEKAEIIFDEAATGILLDLNGSKIDNEEDIVHALAKAGGLSEDSAKVCFSVILCSFDTNCIIRLLRSLLWRKPYEV